MSQIYECPNGCHVTDKQKRCPKCGTMLLGHGSKTKEEVLEDVKKRQDSYRKELSK